MNKIVTLTGKPKFIVMSDADSSSLGLSDEEDKEELRMFHEPKRFQNSLDLINERILEVPKSIERQGQDSLSESEENSSDESSL